MAGLPNRLLNKSCVSCCDRFLDLLSAKSFRSGGYWFVTLHMTNEIWIKIKRSRPGCLVPNCAFFLLDFVFEFEFESLLGQKQQVLKDCRISHPSAFGFADPVLLFISMVQASSRCNIKNQECQNCRQQKVLARSGWPAGH